MQLLPNLIRPTCTIILAFLFNLLLKPLYILLVATSWQLRQGAGVFFLQSIMQRLITKATFSMCYQRRCYIIYYSIKKKIFFTIYNLISIHSHNQYSLNFSRLLYPIVEILDPTLIEEIVGGYFFYQKLYSCKLGNI